MDSICRFYSAALRQKDPAAMKAAKEFFHNEIKVADDMIQLHSLVVAHMDGRDPADDDGVLHSHRGRPARRNDEL